MAFIAVTVKCLSIIGGPRNGAGFLHNHRERPIQRVQLEDIGDLANWLIAQGQAQIASFVADQHRLLVGCVTV